MLLLIKSYLMDKISSVLTHFHFIQFKMATAEQILDDVLDWCLKNTNTFESKGEDEDGGQISFIHFAAEKGYVQVLKKIIDSGIDVNCAAPNRYKSTPLHYASLNAQ